MLGAGRTLLEQRYYLDHVYTDGVVGSIKGPIARGAYFVNQKWIDGIVNGIGVGSKRAGHIVYDVIDQKLVDGAVNGIGLVSEESGAALRQTQTGRVQQYAALLFAAVGILGLIFVLTT